MCMQLWLSPKLGSKVDPTPIWAYVAQAKQPFLMFKLIPNENHMDDCMYLCHSKHGANVVFV